MHYPFNSKSNPDQNEENTGVSKTYEHITPVVSLKKSQKHQNFTADLQEPEVFATQWFRERSRQAKLSFNIAVGLAGTTAVLSTALAISVVVGKVPVAAIAGLGSISGAVSACCFKLSQNANKQLDAAAKELLDNK